MKSTFILITILSLVCEILCKKNKTVKSNRIASVNKTVQTPSYGEYYENLANRVYFNYYFRTTTLTPYPVKEDGRNDERIAYEDIKLSSFSVYLAMTFYLIPSILILIHLTRRIPVNHNYKVRYYTIVGDPAKQLKYFNILRNERLSSESVGDSAAFWYQLWTSNLSTSKKLTQTFENDFDTCYSQLSPEEYLAVRQHVVQQVPLKRQFLDEDDI